MNDRLPEVIVNADLARLADPPRGGIRRRLAMLLIAGNIAAALAVFLADNGPIGLVLAACNMTAAETVVGHIDAGRYGA